MKKCIQFLSLVAVASIGLTLFGCPKKEDIDDRTKFLGTYKVTGTCSPNNPFPTTTVTIKASSSTLNEVLLTYSEVGASIKATILGDKIDINGQKYTVSGTSISVQSLGNMISSSILILHTIYLNPSTLAYNEV